MKKTVIVILIIALAGVSLYGCTPYHTQGAVTGAAVGGAAGALLNHHNPWTGGVVGAAIGAVVGATIADISLQASREAAASRRPVEYRTEDNRGVYRADPGAYDPQTRCTRVHERAWEDGVLVRDEYRTVCN